MSAAEEEIEAEALEAELKMRAELSIRQRRHVITSAARQQAEKDRREQLRRQIQAEIDTALNGCDPLKQAEKAQIRERVLSSGLIWRGIGL